MREDERLYIGYLEDQVKALRNEKDHSCGAELVSALRRAIRAIEALIEDRPMAAAKKVPSDTTVGNVRAEVYAVYRKAFAGEWYVGGKFEYFLDALEFYADPRNYHANGSPGSIVFDEDLGIEVWKADRGEIARKALELFHGGNND